MAAPSTRNIVPLLPTSAAAAAKSFVLQNSARLLRRLRPQRPLR